MLPEGGDKPELEYLGVGIWKKVWNKKWDNTTSLA